ncbi:hypothetical protein DMC30DRAFT_447312 [Rhodotorula diobovata]|uniref:Uncharacterized protein n=1 Tax=Rhodotorula diobovata TaxID=5288 RepID=A0A5C5FVR4_9BASI|nr:hypothetical protein DMC30DRAFT_447312 [Rhodotorula diobovata]
MAPPGRRTEEIYAHPPPFAPPFSPDEPTFPPAGQSLIPERIDDNKRGPKGLMYLTKMKGWCICIHVKAELLEPHPDHVEEYWKRDDEAANKVKREEQARKRKEKEREKQQQLLEGEELDPRSATVDKRSSSSIDSPSQPPQPPKKARTGSTSTYKAPTKMTKALPKAEAVKKLATVKRKEPNTPGAIASGPKRPRTTASTPLIDQDLDSLPSAVGALSMSGVRRSGRAQKRTARFLEGAAQEDSMA